MSMLTMTTDERFVYPGSTAIPSIPAFAPRLLRACPAVSRSIIMSTRLIDGTVAAWYKCNISNQERVA
jgi:hypothetical protein